MSKSYVLHIENFLTIEKMEVPLSGIRGYVGKNAQGKTNILTALQSIIDGTNDIKKIMDGKKRYELKLEELTDGEVTASVSRIQTQSGNRLEGNLPGDETPKKFLSRLLDEKVINPIRLISEDPVKYLKQHLPIKALPDDLPDEMYKDQKFDLDGNAFEECEKQMQYYEGIRRGTYQDMRHAKEVVSELRMDLPIMPEKPGIDYEKLDRETEEVKRKLYTIEEKNKNRDKIVKDLQDNETQIMETEKSIQLCDEQVKENGFKWKDLASQMAERLKEVKEEFLQKQNEIQKQVEVIKETKRLKEQEKERLRTRSVNLDKDLQSNPKLDQTDLEKQLAVISNDRKTLDQYNDIKKRYDRVRQKEDIVASLKQKHDKEDELFKYFAYKMPKTLINRSKLPVPGLEFKDQDMYINNRHIERLSSAERANIATKLAIGIAKMKNMVAIGLDGIENMDDEHRKEFLIAAQEATKDNNFAVLYTRYGTPEYEHETEIKR